MVDIVQSGLAADVVIQGHSPLLMGRNLNAYIAGGIDNDHELRQGTEGLEKLRLGLFPLLKVSSYGNHVPNILPALKTVPYLEIALCTDDIEPADLLENGHMDRVIREMMSHGIEPAVAIRWATYVGARHYKLRDHGAIAPGYYADIVLLSSLEEVTTSEVLVGGKLVVENGRLLEPIQEPTTTVHLENSVHVRYPLSAETFRLKAPVKEGRVDLNLIAIQPNRMTDLETVSVPVSDYELDLAALGPDICYVSVVPRHGQPHPPTLALLKGLGLRRGTIASSIAHDSHNILVVGHLPDDMLLAVRRLEQCRGGVVIVNEGEIVAEVELPVAGLMSFKSVAELAGEMKILNDAARDCGININPQAPALAITGLALTVIPKVRISDLGSLFDVSSQEFRPVFP
jgi:adenine deaminase